MRWLAGDCWGGCKIKGKLLCLGLSLAVGLTELTELDISASWGNKEGRRRNWERLCGCGDRDWGLNAWFWGWLASCGDLWLGIAC